MTATENGRRDEREVAAWDGPARLFHWLLVALVLSAWISAEFSSALGDRLIVWHRWNGLAILVLLVWRLLWGLFGSQAARFSVFIRSPRAAIGYARDLIAGETQRYLGHNPLGAYMVLALLAALVVQAGFGLFATDDNDLVGGPLYRLVSEDTNDWATSWHARIFDVLILPLVAIHIGANIFYSVVKHEPLIRAMFTGTKPAGPYADADAITAPLKHPLWRAFLCLLAAKAIVLGTIFALSGRIGV